MLTVSSVGPAYILMHEDRGLKTIPHRIACYSFLKHPFLCCYNNMIHNYGENRHTVERHIIFTLDSLIH